MFKKIISFLICCMLIFSITACTDNSTAGTGDTEPASETVPEAQIDTVVIKGVELALFSNLTEDILSALGTPEDTMKAPSCHFDGEDTIYTYGSFMLYTYAEGDEDVLYLIKITDDSVKTSENITVGSSYEDVVTAYGTPADESVAYAKFAVSEDTAIRFNFDENRSVSSIEYSEK